MEIFVSGVDYSLSTDYVLIFAIHPPLQPHLSGYCSFYLVEVQIGLKGLSIVMLLLASPSLRVLVRLKGFTRVISLPSSSLVPIPLFVAIH